MISTTKSDADSKALPAGLRVGSRPPSQGSIVLVEALPVLPQFPHRGLGLRAGAVRNFSRQTAKTRCALFLIFMLAPALGSAADVDSPVARQEAQKMRAVLEENFRAVNEENLRKLLATTSRYTGTPEQMAQFAAEAKQMFKELDVYMRLVDFELVRFQPPRAYAMVTQLTLPTEDKAGDDELAERKMGRTHFRHNSGLLPEYELCRYKQRFNFEGGRWKVHRIVSEPEKAEWPRAKE